MERSESGGQAARRACHCEGRRPRHRQESRRHHPHQQRLRGFTTPASRCPSTTCSSAPGGGPRRRDIGMSGLLVKSTLIMRENLEEMNRRGALEHPGAARRRRAHPHLRGARPARDLQGPCLLRHATLSRGCTRPRAADGVARLGAEDADFGRLPTGRVLPTRKSARLADPEDVRHPRCARSPSPRQPSLRAPFTGTRVAKGIPLDDIARLSERDGACSATSGATAPRRERATATSSDAGPRRAAGTGSTRLEGRRRLRPAGRLGLLRGEQRGQRPHHLVRRRAHAPRSSACTFPRQAVEPPYLCIADFFRPVDSTRRPTSPASSLATIGARRAMRRASSSPQTATLDYVVFARSLGGDDRGPGRACGTAGCVELGYADEDGPSLTGLFLVAATGAGATPSATPPARAWRTTPRSSSCCAPSASASRSRRASSSIRADDAGAIVCHHPQGEVLRGLSRAASGGTWRQLGAVPIDVTDDSFERDVLDVSAGRFRSSSTSGRPWCRPVPHARPRSSRRSSKRPRVPSSSSR